ARELLVRARMARRRPFRLLPGVVGRDLLQIRLGEIREQALHDRVAAAACPIVLELCVEIACGLPRDRRKVDFARRAAALAVARRARGEALDESFVVEGISLGEGAQGQQGESGEQGLPVRQGVILLDRAGRLSQLLSEEGMTVSANARPEEPESGACPGGERLRAREAGGAAAAPPWAGRGASTRGQAGRA